MSVLDSIIRYKEIQNQNRRQDFNALTTAAQSIAQQRQANLLMQFEKKKLDADLAARGLRMDETGRVSKDTSLLQEEFKVVGSSLLRIRPGETPEPVFTSPKSPLDEMIERGKLADALLKEQEAQDAGLLGDLRPQSTPQPSQPVEPQGITAPTEPTVQVPQDNEPVQPSEFVTTQIKAGTRTMENIEAKLDQRTKEKAIDEAMKTTTEAIKANTRFKRIVAMFSGLVAQAKGKKEEQGGLGLVPGIKGAIGRATKQPGFSRTAAFEAQREETIIGMVPILSGQNRFIKSLGQMIGKTVPGGLEPEDRLATLVAQSVTNAFKITMAFDKGIVTPESARRMSAGQLEATINENILLTENEQAVLNEIIDDILKTPVAQQRTLEGITPEEARKELERRRNAKGLK